MNPEKKNPQSPAQGRTQGQDQHMQQGQQAQPGKPQQDTGKNPSGKNAPQRGQNIEVPGRPDADSEQNRGKAYGPGGARQTMGGPAGAGQQGGPGRTSSDQDQPIDEPRGDRQQGDRTGPGADTTPL